LVGKVIDITPIAKEYEDRRREIIETAAGLFSEHGYDQTSVNMIIEEIGIAKGTFYHYFSSKDEVLEVIVDLMVDRVGTGIENISKDESMTALQKLAAGTKFFKTIAVGWEKISEFLHEDRNAHWHLKLENKLVPRMYDSYERIMEQGLKEGVFKFKYPRETGIALLGATGALSGRDHDHANIKSEDPEFVRASCDIFERILGTEQGIILKTYIQTMEELNEIKK
jgi:AcrR family transcriptional regulator